MERGGEVQSSSSQELPEKYDKAWTRDAQGAEREVTQGDNGHNGHAAPPESSQGNSPKWEGVQPAACAREG